MLTDEPPCGNSSNPFHFPYPNGQAFGDFTSNGFIRQIPPGFESFDLSNIRKEILEAIFLANGQHVMATNPALMKLWLQGVFSPGEVWL